YQARLQARFGRNWRRKAPIESMMPLRLAKYGVPLAETAPAGLAAAGIEPALLPPVPVEADRPKVELSPVGPNRADPVHAELPYGPQQEHGQEPHQQPGQEHTRQHTQGQHQEHGPQPEQAQPHPQQQPMSLQKQEPAAPPTHDSPWFAAQKLPDNVHESTYDPQYAEGPQHTPVQIPAGPGRTRPLGDVGTIGAVPHPRQEQAPEPPEVPEVPDPEEAPQVEQWPMEDTDFAREAYEVFSEYTDAQGQYPSVEVLDIHLADTRNVRHPRSTELLQQLMPQFREAHAQRPTAEQPA
ncbi:DUF2637 domain-containing protein, partial [Streptomyces rubiginosohelvolus]